MGAGVVGSTEGGLLIALRMGDLAVHLIGEVPQEADTVLHQLAAENGQRLKLGIMGTEAGKVHRVYVREKNREGGRPAAHWPRMYQQD